MLRDTMEQGTRDAAARFGVKASALLDKGLGAARAMGAFGMAPEAFVQGPAAFRSGGPLSMKNVLWPSIPGQPIRNTLGRIGTVAGAAALPGAVRSDTGESGLSRLLGGIGTIAGGMYGSQAGGLLGLPVGAALGRSLGHGIGNLF